MSRSRRWIEESLRGGRACEMVLHGGSMEPAIRDGDRLVVEPLGEARPGDVVVAARAEQLVTHRLVALDGKTAITRGDACRGDDPPIEARALIGRVVAVRRRSRLRRLVGRLFG